MKSLIFKLGIILLIFAAIIVGVPSLISNRHPRPHPKAEAWKNLKFLYYLEQEYAAQEGRYAPQPDGIVYYKEGDYRSAIQEYQAALELNPDVAELYNVLGLAYEGEQSWSQAIAVYQAGLKAKSLTGHTKVNLLLNLGNCYSRLRQPDIASAYYRKVLDLEPGQAAAKHNLDLITKYFTPLESQK